MPLFDLNLKQLISNKIKEKKKIIENEYDKLIFNEDEWSFISKKLISSILHLNKNYICHRDLKYDNIFIKLKNFKIVLADFGCCVNLKDFNDFKMPYQIDGISKGGAPVFLPPEIMKTKPGKNKFLDYSKSDIYSLGIVLYLMLSGRSIIDGEEKDNWPFDKNSNYIDLPNYINSEINEFLKNILKNDLNERFSVKQAWDQIKILRKKFKKKD
jgi:serine/threonine protein kinase